MLDIEELRAKALEILEKRGVKSQILEHGTETQLTIKRNREAFDKIGLKMNVIHEYYEPETRTEFLGRKISSPVMPAPLSGLVKSVSRDCFKHIVENSHKFGVIPWIGYPIPDKIEDFNDFIWIIKPLKNRKKIYDEIERAEKCGAFAVGIDIDSAAGIKVGYHVLSYGGLSPLSQREISDIVSTTKLPFIAKGILSEKDYETAINAGCRAIVLSNHGGRVLNSAISPIELLKNLEMRIDTLIDSGFRSGTDVFKALALGAKAVLLGRAVVYGLAVDEKNGVLRVLEIVTEELKRVMTLCGANNIGEISDKMLVI
jgi:isopentenyl diphosphate isomerase/L-lactate dehydrogenase-like FMN-dependent dehydrogenase